MAQLSVGEDLFSTMAAVGLISLFALVLAHVYNSNEARDESQEEFELALSVAEQLKNDVLCGSGAGGRLGLITQSEFERALPSFSDLLADRGIALRTEIRSLEGQLLLDYGPEPTNSSSVSLPTAFERAPGERVPSQLVVWVWRD